MAKYFGIEDADLPAAAIHVAKGDLKYFAKHIKPKGVEAWLDDFEVCLPHQATLHCHNCPALPSSCLKAPGGPFTALAPRLVFTCGAPGACGSPTARGHLLIGTLACMYVTECNPHLGACPVQAGKVERHIKSEEAPKDNSGPVKIVTANTFDEIVFGGKDVLIEFYAPWCGHCKALTPIYEQVPPLLPLPASWPAMSC